MLRNQIVFFSIFAGGLTVLGQPAAPAIPTSSLAEVADKLPDYAKPGMELAYSQAFENATIADRDRALPRLMEWLKSDEPRVRLVALLSIGLLYAPSEKNPEPPCSRELPVSYLPVVAAKFQDPDPKVRQVTFMALQSVVNCGRGLKQLVPLILPMLRDPDALTEYPDPFFQKALPPLPGKPVEQGGAATPPRAVIKLPAYGPMLLGILAAPRQPHSGPVDEAMIQFLDRKDQTKSTLSDCLHTLALSDATESVNDEVLRRVFQQNAMTVFLLQFVTRLNLTDSQLQQQREHLIALSKDASQRPSLRNAAQFVAACWTANRNRACQPTADDFSQEDIGK